ncbi:MAG: asparaginase [Firmicutes bacterium]|nr:asparaginase [Bacillota bacterium]
MADIAIELWRGERMESRVAADVAVVDSVGQIRFWFGDPGRATFWRSSAKPFQAMPLVETGAASRFGLTPEEIAICCASHGGEARHLALVEAVLKRIGATAEDLVCGVHPPTHRESEWALIRAGQSPTVLHNNCSGKHAGMLALARALGAPLEGYHRPDHPVQQAIRANVQAMAGLDGQEVHTGVDGCGVPTFYLPLARMAYSYARLVDPRGLDADKAGAALIVSEAMREHPDLISGTGRLEVTLAEALDHRVVAKGGAEAVFCLGIPEKGLGVAIKIDDGNSRVMPTLVAAVLEQMQLLSWAERRALEPLLHPTLTNHAGTAVGEVRVVMHLKSARM